MKLLERRRLGERGAALVEFAMVLPLLLLLLLGVVEYGIAFNQRLTIGNVSQTAARVGTAVGNKPEADMSILGAVAQGVFSLPGNGTQIIKQVQIYKADAFGEPTSQNNVYNYNLVGTPTDGNCDWQPCPDPNTYDVNSLPWPPGSRSVDIGSLDVMGVRIIFAHEWITGGLVPLPDVSCSVIPSNCWQDTAVMRLEPLKFGVGG